MAEFLDKLKKGIDKSVTTVTVKSKEMLETTQLRSQLRDLQEQKREKVEELGNIVYTLFTQGTLDEGQARIHEKCTALVALDQKVREKEEEIRQVQFRAQQALGKSATTPVGQCECGADLYEGTKFCGGCGKPVEDRIRQLKMQSALVSTCPHCGGQVPPNARFCGGCGTALV
jgi:NADH pyrophosphatase NudC (nudix superfamily)